MVWEARQTDPMCGRYTHCYTWPEIVALYRLVADVLMPAGFGPRYNVAPTQDAPVLRLDKAGRREIAMLRWGLIPSWAKDPAIGNRMINARAEGITEKPSFRAALRQRRCLIPASGFYEWQRAGPRKQPHCIGRADGKPFSMAGLWERWQDREGGPAIETFTIITTAANDLLAPIHDRMPAIIDPPDEEAWLGAPAPPLELLRPHSSQDMIAYPVSTWVNSPAHDDPRCAEPLAGLPGPAADER
jgi:putative SOS response-associated peptidase YedK